MFLSSKYLLSLSSFQLKKQQIKTIQFYQINFMSHLTNSLNKIDEFIYNFNINYEIKHQNYERNFWETKMNLKNNSNDNLIKSKNELDLYLGNKEILIKVKELLNLPLKEEEEEGKERKEGEDNNNNDNKITKEQQKILKCFEKTLKCYIIEDNNALELKERILTLEANLAEKRNHMNLGYTHPTTGEFIKASSVQLRNLLRTSDDPILRLRCLEGLRTIGVFISEEFCEIIKLRNRLARSLGYECYYDMKVTQAEGFNKKTLFTILEQLERDTRPIMEQALATLAIEKGNDALLPQNIGYMLSGDISKLKDPYFPFEEAVDVWARSFAALGISYQGAIMRLDLCDRQGKYSNGFCHWPQPAWVTQTGQWIPSQTNFTSLASPKSVGSGHTALVTLMHEGGHAAHFANVVQPSPLFSQERAPTSVSYAENQSMFLDSLVSDADWMGRYALNREGQPIPWNIIEQEIISTHSYEVFQLRSMLAVPFYERALYDLPEEEVTPQKIIDLSYQIELSIQGMLASRPLMSVPHILADESSAYYHGYILAEMSVHQTRKHFLDTYNQIVDNENVGKDLKEYYWKSGNSENFLDLVQNLTKKPLTSDAWVEKLREPVNEVLEKEKVAYEKAVQEGPKFKRGDEVDLNMQILLVHGDEVISDSSVNGLKTACDIYKVWLNQLE